MRQTSKKKNSINEMNENEEKHSNENHLLLFKLCMLFAHINCSIIFSSVFIEKTKQKNPARRRKDKRRRSNCGTDEIHP